MNTNRISYPIIVAAKSGDSEAMTTILIHFAPYIRRYSKRTFFDEYGNRYEYAERIGDPVKDEYGLFTHGSGYEWEYVFRKAFENDPNIGKVSFDCEAGGFFCYGESVDMMADFGRRFRQIMNDTDSLTDLICKAVPEGEQREAELQQLRSTV